MAKRRNFSPDFKSKAALAAFVDAACGKPSVGPDLTEGLESLAVVLAAKQAARRGQKVAVTTAVEES